MARVKAAPAGMEVDVVLNCRTGVTDDPAKYVLMVIEAKCSWAPAEIDPEDTPALGIGSESVCTVMPVALPAAAAPIVRPLRVMVKAVAALIPATAVVMTI